ncbi:hypothetical protein [Nostoc sp. JL23]|uniref:hypothetical protein n=1 Tax=Nostoc sp. JL23 TaxID=2815394 RepID=UPI001D621761|nr:hypothetical protein [Nostoc sp. JL23]MBN3877310.1 hypothetical protein [Nostoc sp. JL23]
MLYCFLNPLWASFSRLNRKSQIPYSPEQLLLNFMIFHFRLMRRCVYEQVDDIDPNGTKKSRNDYG